MATSLPEPGPNPYEAPGCQGINSSRERFFCFFPLFFGAVVASIMASATPIGLFHRVKEPKCLSHNVLEKSGHIRNRRKWPIR